MGYRYCCPWFTSFLALTVFEDGTLIFPANRAGAYEYLLKNTDLDELLRAIRTAANGGATFSPGNPQMALGVSAQKRTTQSSGDGPGLINAVGVGSRAWGRTGICLEELRNQREKKWLPCTSVSLAYWLLFSGWQFWDFG
jgi:hypothetical protein